MLKKHRPLTSVLIKPTGPDCNLNCTYCFYLEKENLFPETKTHRMSPEVQEELIRQVMQQSGNEVSIAWQGGEPTLMGLDFFKRVIELEKKYGHGSRVLGSNSFQTNGTLLTTEWAQFFKKYDWLIGLSLDGPQHIHDRYRHDKGENPTWEKVESVAKMLLEEGVSVNAMCCITDYSSNYAEELYNYYKSLGLTWMQFIPIVETDKDDPSKAAKYSLTDEQYGKFLITLFDLWISDFRNGEPTTSVRQFESVFYTYVGLEAPECALMKECGAYVVVEHNGNVYSCDFFVEPKWKQGNIMHDRIINMLNSKKQQTFGSAKAVLPYECRQCGWLRNCFGGCTKDRIKDPEDHRKPRFCASTKMFLKHADPILRTMAEQWKEKQNNQKLMQKTGGVYNAFDDFMKK